MAIPSGNNKFAATQLNNKMSTLYTNYDKLLKTTEPLNKLIASNYTFSKHPTSTRGLSHLKTTTMITKEHLRSASGQNTRRPQTSTYTGRKSRLKSDISSAINYTPHVVIQATQLTENMF